MNTFSYLRTAPPNFFKAFSVGLILNNLANTFNSGATVIWGSPRYGHPHSQTLVILASPVTLTLTLIKIAKVI